jgi:hypothetical protein
MHPMATAQLKAAIRKPENMTHARLPVIPVPIGHSILAVVEEQKAGADNSDQAAVGFSRTLRIRT